jgi:GT2 family glycosyltransferase
MMSKVYVLIPSHNNKKEVLEILGCLDRQTYNNLQTILVDDGSADNTADEVSKSYPETVTLKGDGNLWWTGANVMGVDYILRVAGKDDFILLLNNDLVVENDYVEKLVNASRHFGRAVAGSVLFDYDNHDFVESGVRLSTELDLIVNRDRELFLNTDYDTGVDTLPGRGTLVPIEVFRKIGNFNREKLPHYGADYEFTVRARRAGYKLIVAHRAKVYAKLNITGLVTPDKRFISMRECFTLLFSKKSKTNIYYYLNYVWLCSEKKYRFTNTINSARGIISGTLGKTILGYPIRMAMHVIALVSHKINLLLPKKAC